MSEHSRNGVPSNGLRSDAEGQADQHSADSQNASDSSGTRDVDPEEGIHVSLRVPDRPTLHDALRSLVQEDIPFEINRISDAGENSSLAIVDMDEFTDKQREALRAAYEHGYYETPREADLGVISDDLGVSKSAISQRLRAIESKLVHTILVAQTDPNGE